MNQGLRRIPPRMCAAVLGGVLSSVSLVGAAPAVELVLAGCNDSERVREIFFIELETLRGGASGQVRRVEIQCQKAHADIAVRDPEHERRWQRTLPLTHSDPDARARWLAIAASELVEESWFEPVPAPRPTRDAPPQPNSGTASLSRQTWGFGGVAAFWAGAPQASLLALALGGERRWASSLASRLQFAGLMGSASVDLARVSLTGGSVALTTSVGADLGLVRAEIGPGLRGGYLHLAASSRSESANGRSFGGWWGGPLLAGRIASSLGTCCRMELEAEAGWVTLPIDGVTEDGEPVWSLKGAWWSAGVGLGRAF